jgi:spore coat protein CotH
MSKKYNLKCFTFFRIFIVLVFSFSTKSFSQVQFVDSNLPIIIINTDIYSNTSQPLEIIDEPKVLATMKIVKRPDGNRNYLTDANSAEFLNYNGRIKIELRGSSSMELPKKSYSLTTVKSDNTSNNNVSILGMPSENDWVLNSLAFDPSLIRDYLSYDISRKLGNYASRTQYCEVVLNGDYVGLYVFQEKIKANANRVDVSKIEKTDISSNNLTGGYITKADRPDINEPPTWVMEDTNFVHVLPKPENATPEQTAYIKGEFDRFSDNLYNYDLENGYQTIIDVPSFVDFMLVNELSSNADAYQYSTFFHKDRGGKLRAGPIWDLNLSFGSSFTNSSDVDQWQFSNGNKTGPWFWAGLFDNRTFPCYFSRRWNEMIQPNKPMNLEVLTSFIDNTLLYIGEAIPREHERWSTLANHTADIANIKTFIAERIVWITNNIGPYSNCSNVEVPPLVITKINYNPSTTTEFPVNSDLEFIAIQNTGSEPVNLSGIYLSQLGTNYQFPYNAVIGANETIYLCGKLDAFQRKYGFAAFGQYSRNLSNTSQKIVLADSYGNVIDSVEYFDTIPWPLEADGMGSYLQLVDTSLDNNIAANWQPSTDAILSHTSFASSTSLRLYPNPVATTLTIQSTKLIERIKVYDVLGSLLQNVPVNSNLGTVSLSTYAKGVYFVAVYDENGFTTKKIIKQ